MKIPKAVDRLISHFESLPGIGPKSAQRLAFYLLHVPQDNLDSFSDSLARLKQETHICQTCFNIGDSDVCQVCSDTGRDSSVICVVEDSLDVMAIEKSGKFEGVFHVLHGVIDPLNSIGPEDIYIPQFLSRVREGSVSEIILATNPTMEGEATAMYITRELKGESEGLKISRIGHGLPIGADIEYADEITVARALESRREY